MATKTYTLKKCDLKSVAPYRTLDELVRSGRAFAMVDPTGNTAQGHPLHYTGYKVMLAARPNEILDSRNSMGERVEDAFGGWRNWALVPVALRELPAPVSEPTQVTLKPNGSEPYAYIETEVGPDLEVYQKATMHFTHWKPLRRWAENSDYVFARDFDGVRLVKPADRKSCAQYVPVYPAFYIPQYHEPMVEISFVL